MQPMKESQTKIEMEHILIAIKKSMEIPFIKRNLITSDTLYLVNMCEKSFIETCG